MDFRGAWQPFGASHEPKARSVIPVQSTFRSGPNVTGSVLRQREDGQILKPFGSPVVAETVLLGNTRALQRQNYSSTHTEAMAPTHHRFLYITYRSTGEELSKTLLETLSPRAVSRGMSGDGQDHRDWG